MVLPAKRFCSVPSMEGVRWAFSCGTWLPSRAEWLLAVRSIQPEEKERIGQFVFARDAKAAMVLQVFGRVREPRMRRGAGLRGVSLPLCLRAPRCCALAAGRGEWWACWGPGAHGLRSAVFVVASAAASIAIQIS